MRAAGYPIVTREELPPALAVEDGLAHIADQDTYIAYTMAPDDVKVEFVQSATEPPMALHHLHFAGPVDEMQAWYVDTFGAARGMRGSFQEADLPGVNLTFSGSAETPAGTQGTVLDHIGFEVDGLEAFCRELEAKGVVFDRPYSEIAGPESRHRLLHRPVRHLYRADRGAGRVLGVWVVARRRLLQEAATPWRVVWGGRRREAAAESQAAASPP